MADARPFKTGKVVLALGLAAALTPLALMALLWLWILIRGMVGGGVAWRLTGLFQALAILAVVGAVVLLIEVVVVLVWRLIRRD